MAMGRPAKHGSDLTVIATHILVELMGWRVDDAAAVLNISRRTLYNHLKIEVDPVDVTMQKSQQNN